MHTDTLLGLWFCKHSLTKIRTMDPLTYSRSVHSDLHERFQGSDFHHIW